MNHYILSLYKYREVTDFTLKHTNAETYLLCRFEFARWLSDQQSVVQLLEMHSQGYLKGR